MTKILFRFIDDDDNHYGGVVVVDGVIIAVVVCIHIAYLNSSFSLF